jgi:hypothetical protein
MIIAPPLVPHGMSRTSSVWKNGGKEFKFQAKAGFKFQAEVETLF